ncbi:MAG: SPFH domain-containing protein [SAR202 cluster bacterium]|jgi:membrane protease subunit (stomatin/prohibitin family)|nr:SPFH domain-containing protein [SAR202 cluster bacterium]
MALIDIVKYDAPDDTSFVWKYPSEDLKIGSQVIVNQGQEVIFVKGGQALDLLEPGTHTLSTGNIPLLNKLINLPFGGSTPFTAEVWYINKTVKRDLKWGTPSPIQIMDSTLGFPVSVRSFGKWGARIQNSRSFVAQIVGSQLTADHVKISDYFIGEIIQKLSNIIATAINVNKISILQITASLNELSKFASEFVKKEFERFGLEVVNFNIESINIPEEEMEKIQKVFEKTLEAKELSKVQVGGAFSAIKTFEVLNAAADNPSDGAGVGAFLGAGIGLGAGLPLGSQMGQKLDISGKQSKENNPEPSERIKKLKEMLDQGLITEDQFNKKREEILKEL